MKSSQWWPVSGEGRNPFCEKYEESVLEWVYDRRAKGLTEAVAQRRLQLYYKRDSGTGVFLRILRNF